jgi:Glycosyltransferases involved in cell wall biogenesis
MKQDILMLWTQRMIQRLIKICASPTVLFAAGAEDDIPALRRALPFAELVWLGKGDAAQMPAGFDRMAGESEPLNGYGVVYLGEALLRMPEEEAVQAYERLRDAGEFVLLRAPKDAALRPAQVFLRFAGLCAYYTDEGACAYAGYNPALRSAEDVAAVNKPRYAVYGIYKNEEKFIERFLNSVRDADEIVLCDTGTTDTTHEIIADFLRRNPEVNLKTFSIAVMPWRFDDAYNAALALVGGDIDLCINMGMDEMLMEGWRSVLDAHWDIRYTRYHHKFQTDWGNGAVSRHNHDRPHVRRGYVWRLPVHEILEYDGAERVCWNNDFWIYHAPDTAKTRASYMPLLEISAKERPDVWKTWSFLAGEYMRTGRYAEALAAIDRAMALPPSDKGYLHKLKFSIYRAQNKADLALLHIDSAIAVMTGRREPYVEKARYLQELGRSSEAYLVLKQAARQTAEITDYHHNPSCWGAKFDELTAQLKEAALSEGGAL